MMAQLVEMESGSVHTYGLRVEDLESFIAIAGWTAEQLIVGVGQRGRAELARLRSLAELDMPSDPGAWMRAHEAFGC